MPKHELLNEIEREHLLGIPVDRDELARLYTLEPSDIGLIRLRRGDRNRLGVALQLARLRHPGMTLAVGATVFGPGVGNYAVIAAMLVIGSAIGWYVAKKVAMTEMPQLVAALHSFVGLAAVFIGFNADLELGRVLALDEASRQALTGFAGVLAHKTGVEIAILRVEVFLGVFIGAVTFTGSIVAFGKLAGKVDGKARKLPGGHGLNAGAALLSLILLVLYVQGAGIWALVAMTLLAFFIGYHLIMGIGGADMPVVVSMGVGA